MSDLAITVDVSDVVAAEKRLNSMQNQLDRLFKKYKSGSVSQDAFKQGLLQLKREYAAMGVSHQKASGQIEAYVRSLQKSHAAQEKAADMKKYFAAQRQKLALIKESERMEKRAAQESLKASQQQSAAIRKLRSEYQKGYATFSQAREEIRRLSQAKRAGVISSEQYRKEIRQLRQEYTAFTTQAEGVNTVNNRFAKQAVGNTRVMNDFGMATQQVGYQVGDFLVQVQSGTNWMVAFGQQATQLVGILPLLSNSLGVSATKLIGISATLGIIIPLATAVGAAFMRTRDAAKEEAEAVSDLDNEYQNLIKTLRDYGREKALVEQGVTSGQDVLARRLQEARNELQAAREAQASLKDEDRAFIMVGGQRVEQPTLQTRGAEQREKEANLRVSQAQLEVSRLENQLQEQRLLSFYEQRRELLQQNKINKQILEFGEDSVEVERKRREIEVQNYALSLQSLDIDAKRQVQLVYLFKEAQRLQVEVEEAAKEAERTAKAVSEISGLELPFTAKVAALAEKLGIAADEAKRLLNNLPVGVTYGDPNALANLTPDQLIFGGIEGDKPNKGDGGGGAAQESALARLQKQVDLERRLLEVSDAKARVIRALGDDYDKYNATMGDSIQTLIENIEKTEELKNKQAEIQGVADTIQSSMSDAFMSMVDGTKSASDAFKDMARAIIKELYDVLVVQRLVGSFDAKSGEGTGLLGMIMGGIFGKATGGTMNPGMPYLVGEKGPEIVMPGTRSTVMNDNLSAKAMGGGGQLVDVRVFVDDNGNFDAKVDRISRQNISRAAPAIVQQSVGEVVNKVKRGGSTKDAFR